MSNVPNLFRTIHPDNLHLPHHATLTNGALYDFMNPLLRPGLSIGVKVFMLCDVVQCLVTFGVCSYVVFRKGRARKMTLFSLRRSQYGIFIVPNAVCILLFGVCVYLLFWSGYCTYIVAMDMMGRTYADIVWLIPYPWLPLAIGAFLCAYGFALTCSPRSPISNFSGSVPPSTKLSWMHLPIPHSAWLMNTFVIGVTLVAFVFNTTVHSINVVMRNRAHRPGHDFSGEVLQQHHTQEWRDQIPTTAMLAFARVGWSDLLNVYRFCSMAYLSFTAMISLIVLILLLYAVPNQIFLINHVCDIYPGPLPANCVKDGGFFSNLRLLYRLGLPRNLHGSKYHAFKKMWMVTMVGHSQAVWLINGAALFLFIPAYLATSPWRKLMQGKSLRNTIDLAFGWVITVAFITAFWITALSATMTLDDIFRAVSGMGEVKPETRANDQETAVNSEVRSHVQLVSADSNNGEKRVATRTISFLGDRMGVRQEPTFSGSSATLTDEKQNITTSDHSANHTGIRVTIVKETIVS